jgi:hypothetical protein
VFTNQSVVMIVAEDQAAIVVNANERVFPVGNMQEVLDPNSLGHRSILW